MTFRFAKNIAVGALMMLGNGPAYSQKLFFQKYKDKARYQKTLDTLKSTYPEIKRQLIEDMVQRMVMRLDHPEMDEAHIAEKTFDVSFRQDELLPKYIDVKNSRDQKNYDGIDVEKAVAWARNQNKPFIGINFNGMHYRIKVDALDSIVRTQQYLRNLLDIKQKVHTNLLLTNEFVAQTRWPGSDTANVDVDIGLGMLEKASHGSITWVQMHETAHIFYERVHVNDTDKNFTDLNVVVNKYGMNFLYDNVPRMKYEMFCDGMATQFMEATYGTQGREYAMSALLELGLHEFRFSGMDLRDAWNTKSTAASKKALLLAAMKLETDQVFWHCKNHPSMLHRASFVEQTFNESNKLAMD